MSVYNKRWTKNRFGLLNPFMRKEGKTSSKQELLLRIYFSSWIGNLVLMSLSHCRTDWLKNKNVNFSTCWMNVNLKLEGQFTIQRGVPQTSCQHLPNLLISFHRRLQLGKTWIKFSKLELLSAFRKHFFIHIFKILFPQVCFTVKNQGNQKATER